MAELGEEKATGRLDALLSLLPLKDGDDGAALLEHIKALRNMCARGSCIQRQIVSHPQLCDFMRSILFHSPGLLHNCANDHRIKLFLWQLLANSVVNNKDTQQLIGTLFGDSIIRSCVQPPIDRSTDIRLMILYNILKGGSGAICELMALRCSTQLWQLLIDKKCEENLEFLHYLYEYFLVNNRSTVRCYAQLGSFERVSFLDYIASYLRNDSPNGQVGTFLMQYLSKEFKMKSDCILRQSTNDMEKVQPREAYSLLRVIAAASGSVDYAQIYSEDHALFLNVSSLLRCVVAASKEATKNAFTPLNKLDEVALTSDMSVDFEKEVSFELKTMLVRSVANLLYKNPINKGYCLDTQLIPALLECTNMDARNPLMREWSILAIRNACVECPEIQEKIANLTNQGMLKNDIVNDLHLEMGSLRIQSSKFVDE